jgi:LysR family hca operon transcriptional activator
MRGPIDEPGIDGIDLFRESIVVVLPAHHALARRRRIPVHLLDDLPCITMERSLAPALHDSIAAIYRQARIRMHAVSSADNVLGHLQMVQEGLGFALLPESVGSLLPPGVVMKPLDAAPAPTVTVVLAVKAGPRSPVVQRFIDLVRACCEQPHTHPGRRRAPTDVRGLTRTGRKS